MHFDFLKRQGPQLCNYARFASTQTHTKAPSLGGIVDTQDLISTTFPALKAVGEGFLGVPIS